MAHYYDVIETKTGKTIWQSGNTGCFNEYMTKYKTLFVKGHFMRVFFPKEDVKLAEDLIKKWVKYLSLIGHPIKMQKVESLNRPVTIPIKDSYYSVTPLMGAGFIFDFDFDKYRSPGHVKIALHIWRHCYEYGMEAPLRKAFQLKEAYPKASLLELLQFAYMFKPPTSGHSFYYADTENVVDIKTTMELKQFLNKKGEDYFDPMQVNNWFTRLRAKNSASYYENTVSLKEINPDKDTQENPIVYKKKLQEWRKKKKQPA